MRHTLLLIAAVLSWGSSGLAAEFILDPSDTQAINACDPSTRPCIVKVSGFNYFTNPDGTPTLPGQWPGLVILQGTQSFAGMPAPQWWSGADHFMRDITITPSLWAFTQTFRNGLYTATWSGGENDEPFTPLWCNVYWQICRDAGRPAHGAYGEYALIRADLRNTPYAALGWELIYRVTHPACVINRGIELAWPKQYPEINGNCIGSNPP